jgi:hypothetical protein
MRTTYALSALRTHAQCVEVLGGDLRVKWWGWGVVELRKDGWGCVKSGRAGSVQSRFVWKGEGMWGV